jgi:hypothetical protein
MRPIFWPMQVEWFEVFLFDERHIAVALSAGPLHGSHPLRRLEAIHVSEENQLNFFS